MGWGSLEKASERLTARAEKLDSEGRTDEAESARKAAECAERNGD